MNSLIAKAAIKAQVYASTASAALKEEVDGIMGDWNIVNVLGNAGGLLKVVGGALMIVIGIVMIIVGIVKIATGLISHGKTQVNWVINILLILVGALFCAGGSFFAVLTSSDNNSVGAALADTLNELGNG